MSTSMMVFTGICAVAFFLFQVWTKDYVNRHGWDGYVARIAATAFKFQCLLMCMMGGAAVYSLTVYYSAGLPPPIWPLARHLTAAEFFIVHVALCAVTSFCTLPRITIMAALTSWLVAAFCLYDLWLSLPPDPSFQVDRFLALRLDWYGIYVANVVGTWAIITGATFIVKGGRFDTARSAEPGHA